MSQPGRTCARTIGRTVACLALAGASEPTQLAAARAHKHPFGKAIFTTDAHAACIGAHGERDGALSSRVPARSAGRCCTDKPIGSVAGECRSPTRAAAPGLAVRRCAASCGRYDGRIAWTPLLRALFADFANNPHAIVRWTQNASPRDFGSLAPRVFDHAGRGDPVGNELAALAAGHIDALAARIIAAGATRLALVGGCAPFLKPRLGEAAKSRLVEPARRRPAWRRASRTRCRAIAGASSLMGGCAGKRHADDAARPRNGGRAARGSRSR